MQIFCDMDGVLADFDTGYELVFGKRPSKTDDNVDWKLVRNTKGFYENLPPMHRMEVLWNYIRPYDPIIITGVPSSVKEAPDNKKAWIKKYLGDVPVICCASKDKSLHMTAKGDILIDDWEKYMDVWCSKGGVWITHTHVADTIFRLHSLGI